MKKNDRFVIWGLLAVGMILLIAWVFGVIAYGYEVDAPLWTLVIFVGAGSLAIWGVIALARHHPVVARDFEQPETPEESDADAHTGPG